MDITLKQELLKIIDHLESKKILVIGDLMLDQYIWGTVNRISPEAPIPILMIEKEEFRLGAAANVAVNLKALGCEVIPIGLIGTGVFGKYLIEKLEEYQIPNEGIIENHDYRTIVKHRIITSQQQLLRLDREKPFFLDHLTEQKILGTVHEFLDYVDAVIISDYRKGVLNENVIQKTIQKARAKNIPIICDPGRGTDIKSYRHTTTIKPNRAETESITGIKIVDTATMLQAAEKLQEQCQADFLSMSLDKDGILYYVNQNHYKIIKTEAKEVFDVTGAGDMVSSILAILLAMGETPEHAINMANVAAGLEISHVGVVPITWAEIQETLSLKNLKNKIVTLPQLQEIIKNEKQIILTNGYFDDLTANHLRFLQEVSRFPGKLIVAINSDESIFCEKGNQSLLSQEDRANLLASIENISWIVIFNEHHVAELIRALQPTLFVKGGKNSRLHPEEQHVLDEYQIKVEFMEYFA